MKLISIESFSILILIISKEEIYLYIKILCTCSGRISLNIHIYFFSEVPIRRLLKMVGDYKSEGQQLMQTLLHAPRPRQRRDAVTDTGRFVHTGGDTTINLIPVFTVVILGVAGINITF